MNVLLGGGMQSGQSRFRNTQIWAISFFQICWYFLIVENLWIFRVDQKITFSNADFLGQYQQYLLMFDFLMDL